MALTFWNDLINKPDDLEELPLKVSDLSASVLAISEDVGEIAGDLADIAEEIENINKKFVYSEDEQVIGTYNGENVYQKTYDVTFSSASVVSGGLKIGDLPVGLSKILSIEGFVNRVSDGTSLNGLNGVSATWNFAPYYGINGLILYTSNTSEILSANCICTIKYTK